MSIMNTELLSQQIRMFRTIIDDIEMPERERQVIMLRFGITKPQTLEEVGKELGVTRERIRQIEAKVMLRISRYGDKQSPPQR